MLARRAVYILVHFVAVPCKTTTSNDPIIGFCGESEHRTVNFSFLHLKLKAVTMNSTVCLHINYRVSGDGSQIGKVNPH